MKIILAHGVLGFDAIGPFHYFNGVAEHIEGAFPNLVTVRTARVDAVGGVPQRAAELASFIANEARTEKVHVFAHSMGGLDMRYALSHNLSGIAGRVATLVTIGTPHLGSEVADKIESGNVAPAEIAHLPFMAQLRIGQPALHDLTTRVATQRDSETHDVRGVRYLYVAGDMTQPGAHRSVAFQSIARVFELAAPNDGVVTLHSATRGGTRQPVAVWPTDHAGEVGWNFDRLLPIGVPLSDRSHLPRYEQLVRIVGQEREEEE